MKSGLSKTSGGMWDESSFLDASKACPIAVEFRLITSIWSCSDDTELCTVSIIVFMVRMVAIIGRVET